MRKKKLIEQNLSLFEQLQSTQSEVAELKRMLSKSLDEVNALKAKMSDTSSEDKQPAVTEPMRRLEEKVIANAALKPDMEYGALVIGKIVMSAAEYSNKLTVGGDESKKELVNLILGKTEVAKAEILTVIESDETFEVKCTKIDQIAAVSKEYFESVIAQIL